MAEFLLELFSEEIPARMQAKAAEDLSRIFSNTFANSLQKKLVDEDLASIGSGFKLISRQVTPRRLVLVVDLPESIDIIKDEKKGPRVGSENVAVQGFLKAAGLPSIDKAEIRKTDKGDFYFSPAQQTKRQTLEMLPEIINKVIWDFEWQKSMRWKGQNNFKWIRPLRSIIALYNGTIINGGFNVPNTEYVENNSKKPLSRDYLRIEFSNKTKGHRFMSIDDEITCKDFASYQAGLKKNNVILDREERKKTILDALQKAASKEGLQLRSDEGLLEEVAGLVEWPVVLVGSIDQQFMSVPDRVLITSMRQHQKYFALLKKDGKLSNRFAVVANIEANDGGKTIVAGNERVLRARLSDAKFFFEQDKAIKLEERLPKLQHIVFHAKLGSIGQKSGRVAALAQLIAPHVGASPAKALDAAVLMKADLVTGMVGEFPELQGYMGGEYAKAQGEDAEVAAAIADHYKPAGANDDAPKAPVSVAVALADKIDTLVAFFAIDEKPTGSKDPFALRRAALGITRILLENKLTLPLKAIFAEAYKALAKEVKNLPILEEKVCNDVFAFFIERLKVYLKDKNIKHDVVNAVLGGDDDDLLSIVSRADALTQFLAGDDGANLLAAYRRAANIVRIEAGKEKRDYGVSVDSRLLQQEAEIKVFDVLGKIAKPCADALNNGNFIEAMRHLGTLRKPLDAFFESVMVNTDDLAVRENRLRLLNMIRQQIDEIADFSKIEG